MLAPHQQLEIPEIQNKHKNIIDHGREILENIGENFNWLCVSLAGGGLILVFFIYLCLRDITGLVLGPCFLM